jgi:ankyrin repeat protein
MDNLFDLDLSLLRACYVGDLILLRQLLEQGVCIGDDIGELALIIASKKGFVNIVTELLNADINVNSCIRHLQDNNIHYNALYNAFQHNHSNIVSLLLYNGANNNNNNISLTSEYS